MKIEYQAKRFTDSNSALIETCLDIIGEYQKQGFALTLRQLYYQLVSRNIIPNTQTKYKRLSDLLGNARLAGLVPWEAIVDQTRNLEQNQHWANPQEILEASAEGFVLNMWETQEHAPEVWIEKDAAISIVEPICRELDVPFFSCRGFSSQTAMWNAGQRLKTYADSGRQPIVFYLGDFDPSGLEMTNDIASRLEMFTSEVIPVRRLALNHSQIAQYNLPSNPVKLKDNRAAGFIKRFGANCYELDALRPAVIADLIRTAVTELIDQAEWNERKELESQYKRQIRESINN